MQMSIRVVCGKGTYIRSLARDIGSALGSGAYLTALCRTRLGDVRIEDCHTFDSFPEWLDSVLPADASAAPIKHIKPTPHIRPKQQ
jgi:tRNA pseudouridine55 synthase